jgi:hypothetical protein
MSRASWPADGAGLLLPSSIINRQSQLWNVPSHYHSSNHRIVKSKHSRKTYSISRQK